MYFLDECPFAQWLNGLDFPPQVIYNEFVKPGSERQINLPGYFFLTITLGAQPSTHFVLIFLHALQGHYEAPKAADRRSTSIALCCFLMFIFNVFWVLLFLPFGVPRGYTLFRSAGD